MDRPMMLNRREAALTFGALWTALTVPTGLGAQTLFQTLALTWTPKALSPGQARVLDVVAELIMPKTDTPGAREAGVPAFVDRAVGGYCSPAEAQAVEFLLEKGAGKLIRNKDGKSPREAALENSHADVAELLR